MVLVLLHSLDKRTTCMCECMFDINTCVYMFTQMHVNWSMFFKLRPIHFHYCITLLLLSVHGHVHFMERYSLFFIPLILFLFFFIYFFLIPWHFTSWERNRISILCMFWGREYLRCTSSCPFLNIFIYFYIRNNQLINLGADPAVICPFSTRGRKRGPMLTLFWTGASWT